MKNNHDNSSMRLDRWLQAARSFKARALAQKHIKLGRVLVSGSKVKSNKDISAGDTINMILNSLLYKFKVITLNHRRRSAPEVCLLYEKDMKTAIERETQKQLDQASRISTAYPDGHPTKRDCRQLNCIKRGSW